MDYQAFTQLGGRSDADVFDQLLPGTLTLFDAVIYNLVPAWKYDVLDFDELDLDKAIVLEIDFLAANGGAECFNGKSDFMLKSASSSGLHYEYRTTGTGIKFYGGVPIPDLVMTLIKRALDMTGALEVFIL